MENIKGDRKDYSNKLQYHRVEKSTRQAISRVARYGYQKHACYDSWKEQENPLVYADALERHLAEVLDGNFFDSESGLSHLDAVVWNAQALTHLVYKKLGHEQDNIEQDNEAIALNWKKMLYYDAYPNQKDYDHQISIHDVYKK